MKEDFRIMIDGLWEYSNEGKYDIFYKNNKVANRNTKQQAEKYIEDMSKLIISDEIHHKNILENIILLLKSNN